MSALPGLPDQIKLGLARAKPLIAVLGHVSVIFSPLSLPTGRPIPVRRVEVFSSIDIYEPSRNRSSISADGAAPKIYRSAKAVSLCAERVRIDHRLDALLFCTRPSFCHRPRRRSSPAAQMKTGYPAGGWCFLAPPLSRRARPFHLSAKCNPSFASRCSSPYRSTQNRRE